MAIKNVELQALNFEQLVVVIRHVHDELSAQASRAVNASLTLRNWLIGLYVEEYARKATGSGLQSCNLNRFASVIG